MLKITTLTFSLVTVAAAGPEHSRPKSEPVRAAVEAAIPAYTGRWHELARLPNAYQDEIERDGSGFSACRQSYVDYEEQPDGRLTLVQRCKRYRGDEIQEEFSLLRARVLEASRGAKLVINRSLNPVLEWMGVGDEDHWIILTGPVNERGDYEYLVTGSPDRKQAWILARKKQLDRTLLDKLVQELEDQGFDARRLVFTPGH